MLSASHLTVAIAIAVVAWSPPADACTSGFARAIVGAPAFEPVEAVTVGDEDVAVQCDADFTCTVTSTFAIAVTAPARGRVKTHRASELSLTAQARAAEVERREDHARAIVALAPGDTELVLRARVELVRFVDGCFTDGVIARHPYLAAKQTSNQRVLQIDTTAKPRVQAPASWGLRTETYPASRHDEATTRLWFSAPHRKLGHGGPLLALGAASGAGGTFRVRGAWEAAPWRPWLVFAVAGETDLAGAWSAALTAEPTTSAWISTLFSMGAGGGVVLADGDRVGARGQLSAARGAIRAIVSVDVFGAEDVTVAGFLGVGL